jgi:hypothetical protein
VFSGQCVGTAAAAAAAGRRQLGGRSDADEVVCAISVIGDRHRIETSNSDDVAMTSQSRRKYSIHPSTFLDEGTAMSLTGNSIHL